jgi:hypothetical protein
LQKCGQSFSFAGSGFCWWRKNGETHQDCWDAVSDKGILVLAEKQFTGFAKLFIVMTVSDL